MAKGLSQDQIRQSLLAGGWKQADIDAAFLQLEAPPSSLPPFPIKPPSAQNPPLKIKEQKSFLTPKILIGVIVLTLLIAAGSGSYFLFIKEKPAVEENKQISTSDSKKQTDSSQNQLSNPQTQQTQSQTSLPATWNECKVLPNENDYVPERIGEEFAADTREEQQPNGFVGKYYIQATKENVDTFKDAKLEDLTFSLIVKKRSNGEYGDINASWNEINKLYTEYVGKEVNGTTISKGTKKDYFGNQTVVGVQKYISGTDNEEETLTQLVSLIPSHNMLIQILAVGNRDKSADVELYYQKWLKGICQKTNR